MNTSANKILVSKGQLLCIEVFKDTRTDFLLGLATVSIFVHSIPEINTEQVSFNLI